LALGTVFGGLAFTLGLLPLSFPFPLIPYLKFDLAETPSFLAILMFGPSVGMIAAVSHLGALLLFGEWTPIGPLMKFLAVSSSLAGIWFASHLIHGRGARMCYLSVGLFSAASRIAVTTAANYLLLTASFPFFLDIAATSISNLTGIGMGPPWEKLFVVLLFTSVYNALHIPLSMAPALILTRTLTPISPKLGVASPWITALAEGRRD